MTSSGFDWFAGIDWSGAKGRAHAGIRIALAEAGSSAPPQLVAPPSGRAWSRAAVLDWLLRFSEQGRLLAGVDFAFAFAFADTGAYFPGWPDSPPRPQELWALIDRLGQASPDYYGGAIWQHPELGRYFNAPGQRGDLFASRRRETERAARQFRSPSPVFNCVGPAGVGTGSLAGMRLLHHLAGRAARWPFEDPHRAPLMLTEIFPGWYFARAGLKPASDTGTLNKALGFYNSQPVAGDFIAKGPDGDEADALVSAAALRWLADRPAVWQLPQAAQAEGWIFGVESSNQNA